jgi:hypothetical protein
MVRKVWLTYKLYTITALNNEQSGFNNKVRRFAGSGRTVTAAAEGKYFACRKRLRVVNRLKQDRRVTHPFLKAQSLRVGQPDKRPTQIGVERLDKKDARYTATDNVSDYFVMAKAA